MKDGKNAQLGKKSRRIGIIVEQYVPSVLESQSHNANLRKHV